MDKDTRSQIQRATQNARSLLEREFAEQLEGTFDIRPDGTIAAVPGDHLDAEQRLIRQKLVAAITHHRTHAVSQAEAVDAYRREAAFTTLNRFVALKILEARQLVQPCISQGEQSSGFKEFTGLAPGLVQLPDKGYRLYIECLFDEIAREVQVLFDRRDPASLLWTRRQALTDLLAILNASELAGVWGEDETIGWVYQYFNSDEERKQMRAESQAPRNSRELAVRNQFFTPRYVVEFLTDNTLGRIWYEMRQGNTHLVEECDYLVRRTSEVFLGQGEEAPAEEDAEADLSQEELLKKTVYIPFRGKKDPRDLKILDPACGSGHFLLYTFDLLLTIYEEGWADEEAPVSKVTGDSLRQDYSTLEELRAAVPGLILRYNLHGIDIDPRAAQIASLALWMRAQRAYNDLGLARGQRQPIRKTNVVVAEPMPGEGQMVEDFAQTLEPAVLGNLFRQIVKEMELAGEAGSLLKIEESIAGAVTEARQQYQQWQQKLATGYLPGFEPMAMQGTLDLSGIDDEGFFNEMEERMIETLRGYAEQAQNGQAYQRRLFAEDAARGFGFIDVCRRTYDAVLMNPPFGDVSPRMQNYISSRYPLWSRNILCAFIERGGSLTALPNSCNLVGAVCDRTINIKSTYEKFRREFFLGHIVAEHVLDLGWNVLDANVEVSSFVLTSGQSNLFLKGIDLRQESDKEESLINSVKEIGGAHNSILSFEEVRRLPNAVIGYYFPSFVIRIFSIYPSLSDSGFDLFEGHTIKSDRYFRFYWELPPNTELNKNSRWTRLFNGTPSSKYYYPLCEVVSYGEDGQFLSADNGTVLRNIGKHYKNGVCFGKRGEFLDAQILPSGFISTVEGKACNVIDESEALILLALLNSRLFQFIINLYCGQHKYSGYVGLFPYVKEADDNLVKLTENIISSKVRAFSLSEKSPWFSGYQNFLSEPGEIISTLRDLEFEISSIEERINESVYDMYQISEPDKEIVDGFCLRQTKEDLVDLVFGDILKEKDASLIIFHWLMGIAFGHHKATFQNTTSITCLEKYPPFSNVMSLTRNGREILVEDEGHPDDILVLINQLAAGYKISFPTKKRLGSESEIRDWLKNNTFDYHLKVYSVGRRRAPIFWQIATLTSSYSVWLFYSRFTKDTFYTVNDYVKHKLEHEDRKYTGLIQEVGPNPSASQRKEIAAQEAFVAELQAFRDEVAIIAPLWNPNLNDGVIINFAPLWRLVPHHRSWQKDCKDCWDKLVKGDYDWAHLAMHLWPERVVPKCQTDRSLAIAHGLEEVFWEADDATGKWKPRQVSKEAIAHLIQERSSPAVKDALKSLLEAPAASGSKQTRSRRKKS